MSFRFLTALPVYNEVRHVGAVLDEVLRAIALMCLWSTMARPTGPQDLLAERTDIQRVRHPKNRVATERHFHAALAF